MINYFTDLSNHDVLIEIKNVKDFRASQWRNKSIAGAMSLDKININ